MAYKSSVLFGQIFPFTGIDDDEFIYENCHLDMSRDLFDIYRTSNSLNIDAYSYSDITF